MLTVSEALGLICQHISAAQAVCLPLSSAHGLKLAEPVISDVDSPPFDKALMDGFAVRSADVRGNLPRLRVQERLTAGMVPEQELKPGHTTQVMTGTKVPPGTDAVVRIEDVKNPEQETIELLISQISPGRNCMIRGESMRSGEEVVKQGDRVTFSRIALLAELGRAEIYVYPRPQVAILATGNELVPLEQAPGPGEIRNSNEPMLRAQIEASGAVPVPLGIARDHPEELKNKIEQGLKSDFLLLTGGVSAGLLDLVPATLKQLGVQEVFHKVHLKPGKPIWFGVFHKSGRSCYVFGLPGNPVSSLVCYELFVRLGLGRFQGESMIQTPSIQAELLQAHLVKGDRPVYYPSRWRWEHQKICVQPCRWVGSADIRGVADANGMVLFPPRDSAYEPGEMVELFPWGISFQE